MSTALIIEVVVFGAIIVWLLALIPAAAITMLKGQWRFFGWGWLTAGFLWFAAALSLAPPTSRWAQRLYDAGQRDRAKRPFGAQRSSLTFGVWAGSAVAMIALLGLFAARPSPILGVNGTALGNSLPDRGGGAFFSLWPPLGPCQRRGAHVWDCALYDQEGSGGTVNYRVKIHGLGCWTATPTQAGGRGKLSGCLTILNFLE